MTIKLPPSPGINSLMLEKAIETRRSCREFSSKPLGLAQVSQILWSAQGVTGADQRKSTPSAGAQYPTRVYLVAGLTENIPAGSYLYGAANQEIQLVAAGDYRDALCKAALDEQPWVGEAALILVVTADFTAMQAHFQNQPPCGERGDHYIFLESGAIAQNVQLQTTALGLGAVLVGGFNNDEVKAVLSLPQNLEPTALICIGARRQSDAAC